MKTTNRHSIITALAAVAALLTTTAAALSAQETGSRYEGSVYVSYFYETTGGLSTVHGARLAGDRWFLGAAASWDLGENGSFLQVDFRPRWFFVSGTKVETFLGCGVGAAYLRGWILGSQDSSGGPRHDAGLLLVPEIGLGIKLGNGDMIDVVLSCNTDILLGGTYNCWDGRTVTLVRPGISIGYRF